jgi:hypothetical protein
MNTNLQLSARHSQVHCLTADTRELLIGCLRKASHSDANHVDAYIYAMNRPVLDFEESKPRLSTRCLLVFTIVGVLSMWLAACGNNNNTVATIISVSVSCSPSSIFSNQTSQCSATVKGTGNFSPSVTWAQTAGSVTSSGAFSPPSVNSQTQVTITVTSVQDATKSGLTTITVNPLPSTITSVTDSCSPSTILSGQRSQCASTVQGTGNFNTSVTWTASSGTITTSGLYTAPIVTAATQVTITATAVQDPTKSGSTTITVNPASTITSVSDACSPSTIQSGQTSQCAATVQGTGSFNSSVTWTASTGTITTSGLYTAPTVTTATQATITATSMQDPTKSGSTTITVNPASTITTVTASCDPKVLQLPIPGASFPPTSQCTASVQGTGNFNNAVVWTASMGSIDSSSGVFTPPSVTVQTPVTITATSAQDATKSGSATITVNPITGNCPPGGLPAIVLAPPATGAATLYGIACNVDTTKYKVVVSALTNQFYVQPFVATPFTNIASDGSWNSFTHAWSVLVALLVDPSVYTPAATEITNPALDPNVIAWAIYPQVQVSLNFSNYIWGVKMTGGLPSDQFDPGPNFWSPDPSVVSVAADGLHLKITQINGVWSCGEVYLLKSLGYGTYTMQVASHLDGLDNNTVAAPLFIYAAPGQELDNEYSGLGGLILTPFAAQFVVQPFKVPGNIVRYVQPSTAQFTTQMQWRADHVTFTAWNGWANPPASSDIIYQWTYTGANIPPVGNERVRINLWLLNGAAPVNGTGDAMVIHSFTFQP